MTERGFHRGRGVVLGAVVAAVVWSLPTPTGLTIEAHKVAVIAVVMALWWVLEVLPMAVTAMMPLVLFPLAGVRTLGEVSVSYAHPLLFLMLGGFVIGHAMEQVGLHRRLTAWILAPAWVRTSPRAVLAALMIVGAALSGIVSNTATMVMMLPLASLLGRRCGEGRTQTAFVLALAYSTSIGGMTTLVGTPPNAVLAGLAPELVGREIGFARWMAVGVPTAVLLLPIAWWAVAWWTFRLPGQFDEPIDAPVADARQPGEIAVWSLTTVAMVAWLTRADKALGWVTIPGWSTWMPGKGSELDALVAMAVALSLFLVPAKGRFLLSWPAVERAVPWSVLLLLGGGFALASAISATGLTAWFATAASGARGLPIALVILLICLLMTGLTELTSNTATATIALPLLATAAVAAEMDPMLWMVPATLSASCAFMMPVATAPNAIAVEGGGVDPRDMVRAGLVLNILGAVAITIIGALWLPLVGM